MKFLRGRCWKKGGKRERRVYEYYFFVSFSMLLMFRRKDGDVEGMDGDVLLVDIFSTDFLGMFEQ